MNAREKEILKKFWDFKVKGNNYKPINGLHRWSTFFTHYIILIILLQIYYFCDYITAYK